MPCINCAPGSPTLNGSLVPCCTYGPYESVVTSGEAPQAQLRGFNASNSMSFAFDPPEAPVIVSSAVSLTQQLKQGAPSLVLRYPGGALANYVHPTGPGYGLVLAEIGNAPQSVKDIEAQDGNWPDNHLDRQVEFATAVGSKVIWVANMYTGTIAEAITSIQAFLDGNIEVVGIELGNEWYLPRYTDKYTDHNDYIADAKVFFDALKAEFPSIPVGIVICPSAQMKDPDAGPNQNARLAAANTAIRLLAWPEAYILHSYAPVDPNITPYDSPAADAVCFEHRVALAAHMETFPAHPIWITEWNVSGVAAGDTDTQINHYTAMVGLFAGTPHVGIQTMHSLMASWVGYNAIKSTGAGCVFNRIGQVASQ